MKQSATVFARPPNRWRSTILKQLEAWKKGKICDRFLWFFREFIHCFDMCTVSGVSIRRPKFKSASRVDSSARRIAVGRISINCPRGGHSVNHDVWDHYIANRDHFSIMGRVLRSPHDCIFVGWRKSSLGLFRWCRDIALGLWPRISQVEEASLCERGIDTASRFLEEISTRLPLNGGTARPAVPRKQRTKQNLHKTSSHR